jgi:hypothetical protein
MEGLMQTWQPRGSMLCIGGWDAQPDWTPVTSISGYDDGGRKALIRGGSLQQWREECDWVGQVKVFRLGRLVDNVS